MTVYDDYVKSKANDDGEAPKEGGSPAKDAAESKA